MKQLKELLTALNTETKDRDQWLEKELIDYLNNKASFETDWSLISPTILGSIFESTLNLETRRKCGIHYTSIENIHKVIDPLFLDDLKIELNEILEYKQENVRNAKLREFQDKIASLTFLDPACGSGNFLIETYLSLRDLEDEILIKLYGANERDGFQTKLIEDAQVKVSINQFYGIEINDFAVDVAKTALWIAEYQCLQKTLEKGINTNVQTLPLKSNNNIIVANALKVDWNDLIHNSQLNYIMGNPPFSGAMKMKEKRSEIVEVFPECKKPGKVDYVVGWFIKSAKYIKNTNIRCALVSTNSVCQGLSVELVWKPLFTMFNIKIDYAYNTFIWDSESLNKSHVYCVIVGFSTNDTVVKKILFRSNSEIITPQNINAYLFPMNNVFVDSSRKNPISNIKKMHMGVMARDGNNLLLSDKEYEEYIKLEPQGKGFIKRYMMGKEFIHNIDRYCFWLVDAEPSKIKKCPILLERIHKVREYRLNSNDDTKKFAETPTLFCQLAQPKANFIAVPKVSSENRKYIPIAFLTPDTIVGDKIYVIENADLYDFGIITSSIHNAWMRLVAGKLESRYSYSNTIVYNNFVWVKPTEQQKEKIEKTAQSILDARNKYPESTLADLYDSLTMPPELRKAHENNDKAVLELYGLSKNSTEEQIVELLFKLYDAKISGNNNTNLELL